MKPILFAENSTTFNTNGIGRLSDAISCTVTEERNGIYELEMVYPSKGAHYSDIGIRSIIVVLPYIGASLQAFRVYQITKPINGQVSIKAQHISYDLSKNTAMPFSVAASTAACNNALQGLKTNAVESCPFSFWTDVQTIASYNQTAPATIRSRLGGVEGSILDQYHGEYEWDNYEVKFHHERGSDNGVVLRYGKNITDIKQDENIANTVTGIVPFWTNYEHTQTVTLPEKAVYSPNAGAYSSRLTVPADFSSDYQDAPLVSVLRSAAQAYVNNHDLGLPKVSIEVSFVNLADTEEYKDDLAALQTVHLCDEITVQFESLGISTKAQIVKYEWDVLGEKYRKLTVGSIRSNLATTLNDQNSNMMNELKKEIVQAGQAADDATAWLTSANGYVIALKDSDGNWEAIAFSSKKNPYARDAKVILINENGIGFSTTGLNGTFSNAWTIDGHLLATFIQGGTLTLGGAGNANGTLRILNQNGVQIGKWDKDGISASGGSFSGSISGSTIQFGSGDNYTRMYWNPNVGSGRGALYIEAYNNPNYTDQITIKADLLYILAELWTEHNLHIGYQNKSANLYVNGNIYLNADRGLTAPQIWDSSHSGLIFFSFHQNPYYDPIKSPSGNPQSKGWYEYSNGQYVLTTDTRVQSGKTYYQYISGGDEHVNFYLSGTSAVVLSHDPTGKQVVWSNASDIRLKENIKDIESDLTREFFDKIKPVSFNFKRDKEHTHFGLIAQELEEVLKDMGLDTEIVGEVPNEQRTKFIDYPALIGLCLKAIKDLYAEVDSLKQQLKER